LRSQEDGIPSLPKSAQRQNDGVRSNLLPSEVEGEKQKGQVPERVYRCKLLINSPFGHRLANARICTAVALLNRPASAKIGGIDHQLCKSCGGYFTYEHHCGKVAQTTFRNVVTEAIADDIVDLFSPSAAANDVVAYFKEHYDDDYSSYDDPDGNPSICYALGIFATKQSAAEFEGRLPGDYTSTMILPSLLTTWLDWQHLHACIDVRLLELCSPDDVNLGISRASSIWGLLTLSLECVTFDPEDWGGTEPHRCVIMRAVCGVDGAR
jgi:hypothetical protein